MDAFTQPNGPLVSVLVPTFNRPRYLAEALGSLVRQTYTRFEAVVVNDGGESVREIVQGFHDPRLLLLERRENRGKAASLNQALEHVTGKYVAYLDDDDLYYPRHLEHLVDCLEGPTDCGAAYTDLYKVHCRVLPDGTRQVLGKVVNISRDFDRFFLCYFNLALHVSLMHRRDLLEKTGPYNESVPVLIDWDMVRRLAFYTDFEHIRRVTGAYHAPVDDCDRISCIQRKDHQKFCANTLRIRTTRPPKPWPKMPDLSLVVLPDRADEGAVDLIEHIYAWTFMPYQVYLPMPASDLTRMRLRMPNLLPLQTPENASVETRVDAALAHVEGDYVAVVQPGAGFHPLWVEDALHAAVHDAARRTAFRVSVCDPARPGFVLGREEFRRVRRSGATLPLLESLRAGGIEVREPQPKECALGFDRVLQDAESLSEEGNWVQAATLYERIAERFGNGRWMRERAAKAFYEAGTRDTESLAICRELNQASPTVSTMLLEARLHKRADRLEEAVPLLEHAELILEGKVQPCS